MEKFAKKVEQTDEKLREKLHLRDELYEAISPLFPRKFGCTPLSSCAY